MPEVTLFTPGIRFYYYSVDLCPIYRLLNYLQQLFYYYRYTVLIAACCLQNSSFRGCRMRIAHGNAPGRCAKHGDVIQAVTKRH